MDEHFEASCALRHLTSEQQEQVKGLSDTLQESLVATATLCRTEDCFGCNPPDESEPRGPAIPVTKRLVPLYEVEVLSSLFNNPLNDDPNDQHSTTWEWRSQEEKLLGVRGSDWATIRKAHKDSKQEQDGSRFGLLGLIRHGQCSHNTNREAKEVLAQYQLHNVLDSARDTEVDEVGESQIIKGKDILQTNLLKEMPRFTAIWSSPSMRTLATVTGMLESMPESQDLEIHLRDGLLEKTGSHPNGARSGLQDLRDKYENEVRFETESGVEREGTLYRCFGCANLDGVLSQVIKTSNGSTGDFHPAEQEVRELLSTSDQYKDLTVDWDMVRIAKDKTWRESKSSVQARCGNVMDEILSDQLRMSQDEPEEVPFSIVSSHAGIFRQLEPDYLGLPPLPDNKTTRRKMQPGEIRIHAIKFRPLDDSLGGSSV